MYVYQPDPINKPRIFRTWHRQRGHMMWSCSELPRGKWGAGPTHEERELWRLAVYWCHDMNKKELLK